MDQVTLYNTTLHHMGGTRVQAVDEPGNAQVLTDMLQPALDDALEKHDWSFARERVTLNYRTVANPEYDPVTNPDVPATIPETYGDWSYVYDLPNDYLCLRNAVDLDVETDIEVLRSTICCNNDELTIVYTSSLRIVEDFPNPFSRAVSYLLAHDSCTRIVGFDPKMMEMFLGRYDVFLRIAKDHDTKRQKYSTKGEYTLVDE